VVALRAAKTPAEADLALIACSSIDDESVFFVLDKLKAAAMTQPTTMAVPHNPAAMIANRREVITRRLPIVL
jgi:hypothetical protein